MVIGKREALAPSPRTVWRPEVHGSTRNLSSFDAPVDFRRGRQKLQARTFSLSSGVSQIQFMRYGTKHPVAVENRYGVFGLVGEGKLGRSDFVDWQVADFLHEGCSIRCGEVAFCQVWSHGHDSFAFGFWTFGHLDRGPDCSTTGDSHRDSF